MKLTEEQITYIENYIKSFDIKYYEVYMKILDHMILSVEAILEENKDKLDDPAVIAKLLEQVAQKDNIVLGVFSLGKVQLEGDLLIEDTPIDLLYLLVGYKVPFQVSLQKELLVLVIGVYQRPEEVVEPICLQLCSGEQQQVTGQLGIGGKARQLLGETWLQPVGKVGIAHQLLIDQIQLVQGCLLAQGEHGDHHIILVCYVEDRIQQVGLAFTILATDDHAFTCFISDYSIKTSDDIF